MWDVPEIRKQCLDVGFAGPLKFFTAQQCFEFQQLTSGLNQRAPLDWEKGQACSSRAFYEVATHPDILKVISSLLGNDVILWGCSLVSRAPGAVHAWHSDIESLAGSTISVWIGIENTTPNSSLHMIAYSHTFGRSVQEIRHSFQKNRTESTSEDILQWAQQCDERSVLVSPSMSDGDVLFFNGRLWHGSNNSTEKMRRALLLQYATADTPIRIPDPNHLDWPFRQLDLPKPPCLLVLGSSPENINRIVQAPVPLQTGKAAQLSSCVYPLRLPLPSDTETGWKPYSIFRGCTPNLRFLSCHVSILDHNRCPHPPHKHAEEEILLVLEGEVDLLLPDSLDGRKRLKCGEFVYYPSDFAHTLRTVSENPAAYLMLRWRNESIIPGAHLPFGYFRVSDFMPDGRNNKGYEMEVVFQGTTTHLTQLQCHTSILQPGAGYAPHTDAYDAAIIVLEGEVGTLEKQVGPCGVVFFSAGQPHGMSNSKEATAKYLVFEFHGSSYPRPKVRKRSLLSKLIDPRCWIRKAKHIFSRI